MTGIPLTYKIYGLIDPETDEICYIGKTHIPLNNRLNGHISMAVTGRSTSKVSMWILDLVSKKLSPRILLIEEVDSTIPWGKTERKWIKYYKSINPFLLNICPGGNGAHSHRALPDEFVIMLGKVNDIDISIKSGLRRESICYHRRKLGIKALNDKSKCGNRLIGRKNKDRFEFPENIIPLVGKISDRKLAKMLNVARVCISRARKEQKIPPFKGEYHIKGTEHHNSKLTPELVAKIRSEYVWRVVGVTVLAKRYGLDPSTVHDIIKYKIWKHVK